MFKTKRSPFVEKNWDNLLNTTYLTLFVNNSCNKSCSYCIMNNSFFNANYSHNSEMSLHTFTKILNLFKKKNINFLRLVGKEPLLWRYIKEGTYLAKKMGFSITIITNGTILNKNIHVDNLNIHIDLNYLSENLSLLKERKKYSDLLGFDIAFMIVFTGRETSKDLSLYKEIVLSYSNYVSLFLKSPVLFKDLDYKAVNNLIRFYRLLINQGFNDISIEHPIPYCLINEKNFVFLDKENIKFGGTCHAGKDFIINFDGKVVFPCIGLLNYVKTLNIEDDLLKIGKKYFYYYLNDLRHKMPKEECYECKWYKEKLCQGGCLVNRYYYNN